MDNILNKILHLTSVNMQHANLILKVTLQIKDHIKSESVNSLNDAIALRQKHIKDVSATKDAIDANVGQLKARYMVGSVEEIDTSRHPKAGEILDVGARTRAIYKEIYHIDEENRKGAEILIRNYKDELKDIHSSKRVTDVYKKHNEGRSMILNKLK
ncbi:MAG TPA: hypothetical protein VFD33_05825 [Bacillota bacterium]|nr:hypothetical protein [Bacillota bacterium]